jgi:hypothetical protein
VKKGRLFLVILLLAAVVLPAIPAMAINFGSGTYGACQYSTCSISIGSSVNLSLDVTPTSSGVCTTQSDSVSVLTDDPNGYTLTLANSSTNQALTNGLTATINSTTATQSSPTSLAVNNWGYRVDGVGGFGAGPTVSQSNAGLDSVTFAQVPASNSAPDVLADTSVAADPAVGTTVWYRVCADINEPSGAYTGQVTYTAITD